MIEISTGQLLAALGAMGALLAYMLRTLFAANQTEKSAVMTAYLDHVRSATESQRQSADAIGRLAEAVNQNTATLREHVNQVAKRPCQIAKEK